MKILVTGGAGFIGSHLIDRLLEKNNAVISLDDLYGEHYLNKKVKNIKKNIVNDEIDKHFKEVEIVFHLAADPMVNLSAKNPRKSFNDNAVGTFNILEACRKSDVKQVIFTSTSAVYGEAKTIPTPEDYPCKPISNYGASKLAGEGYVSGYAHSYGIKGTVLRLANIFGERSTHGVMYDFYNKLKDTSKELEILGDGSQEKSYLHVHDCVNSIITSWKKQEKIVDYFNVGSNEKTTVNEIAKLMCKKLELNPKFRYTGGKRGWVGDIPLMLLDCSRLEGLGWSNKTTLGQGIDRYLEWLKNN